MKVERLLPGVAARGLIAAVVLLLAWPAAATPRIDHWQTANGARVYFVHAPELPMVDVRMVFDAGSARDGEQPGVALLTNALMAEGAGAFDADQIAAALEGVGAQLGNSALRDMSVFSLRSLTDPELLRPALEVFAAVLTAPRFAADDFERERNRMLVSLQAKQQSPGALGADAFFEALYGDHPYAHSGDGTEPGLRALGRDDVAAFHARYYAARNTVVALVGDIDRAQAEAIATQLTAGLPDGGAAPALPAVAPLDGPRRVHITYPSQQTHVMVGQPGMRRGDPDYFPLYLGNHVLGGSGLVSRLSEEIREQRGLAYSVSSYFAPMREAGPFQMSLQTRNDQAGEAIGLLFDELRRFVDGGPSEAELAFSTRNVTGGFPMRIDSNRDIVGNIAAIGFYGMPLDYLDTFTANIEAVDREAVHDAFRRRIDPARMVIVTVGPGDSGPDTPHLAD